MTAASSAGDDVPANGCCQCGRKPSPGEVLVGLGGWAVVVVAPARPPTAKVVCSTACFEKLSAAISAQAVRR